MPTIVRSLAAVAGLAVAATAAQAVTIVQYRQLDGTPSMQLRNSGDGYTLSNVNTAGENVRVTLFDPMNATSTFAVDGLLNFTASGNADAVTAGGTILQGFNGGSFSLTAAAPFSFMGFTGTNILSASFTEGLLSGQTGTQAPTFSVSVPVSAFTSVTSDFFSTDRYRLTNFSIAMSDADPSLALSGNRIRNFQASSVGTFGASAIPEPGTWAMMILGFGLVGATMRRRRGIAQVSA